MVSWRSARSGPAFCDDSMRSFPTCNETSREVRLLPSPSSSLPCIRLFSSLVARFSCPSGKVVALEANKKLADVATEMAKERKLAVECPSIGGSTSTQLVTLSPEANPERITFKQCDPMCLPAGLAGEEVSVKFFLSGVIGQVCCGDGAGCEVRRMPLRYARLV